MCKKIRKNEDKPPAFLILLLPEIKFKIKKPTAVSRKKRHTVSKIYFIKLKTLYIIY